MNKIVIIMGVSFFILSLVGAGAYLYAVSNESYETDAIVSENPQIDSGTGSSKNLAECIITIEGIKYNVADFRKKHPGGDIFKCGEDMTKAFKSQHGAKQLDEIQKYRVQE